MPVPIARGTAPLEERLIVSHKMDRYHRQMGPWNPRNISNSEYTAYRGSGWLYGFWFVAEGGQQRFMLNDAYLASWDSTSGSYENRLPYEFWTNYAETKLWWLPQPWHFKDGIRMTWDSGTMHLVCYYVEDVPYTA